MKLVIIIKRFFNVNRECNNLLVWCAQTHKLPVFWFDWRQLFKECYAPGAVKAAFVTAHHAGLSHWSYWLIKVRLLIWFTDLWIGRGPMWHFGSAFALQGVTTNNRTLFLYPLQRRPNLPEAESQSDKLNLIFVFIFYVFFPVRDIYICLFIVNLLFFF